MSATLKSLRALSDPTRLRIVALLEQDELSVNELQEITRLGQSRISTHLGLLQDAGLLQSRREGKRTFYKLQSRRPMPTAQRIHPTGHSRREGIAGTRRRPDQSQAHPRPPHANRRRFISTRSPGVLTAVYGPGRSWQAFGHLLLRILPPLVVADLGAGEGLLSELLARRGEKSHRRGQLGKDGGVRRGQGEEERIQESGISPGRFAESAD